jgi:type III restriction enzyme
MTPPGQAHQLVTVVEHPAFASLYQQELAHEGVQIEIVDVDKVPRTTITIFPDPKKDWGKLAINIPQLTAAHRTAPTIEGITIEKVRASFKRFRPLPLGKKRDEAIDYEGRHLFTNEVIEKMKINLPLLESGIGALSFYVKELEYICKIRGTHSILAPLLQTFFEEILFEQKAALDDPRLVMRLADTDVREHTRATFVALIRKDITTTEEGQPVATATVISDWKPFQVTHSERHPVTEADRTLFNLVPCNRSLELGFAKFLESASDVVAFAKNAGPQCLRIDYLAQGSRLAFYTPDFFVRTIKGQYCLVETKGREDRDIAAKARAAVAWCKSASMGSIEWRYLYITQGVFERLGSHQVDELLRACEPALQELLGEGETPQLPLLLYSTDAVEAEAAYALFISPEAYAKLPSRYQKSIEQATMLYAFFEKKPGVNLSPAFQPMLGPLDEAAKGLMVRRITPDVPTGAQQIDDFFNPFLGNLPGIEKSILTKNARNLKRRYCIRTGCSLWANSLSPGSRPPRPGWSRRSV